MYLIDFQLYPHWRHHWKWIMVTLLRWDLISAVDFEIFHVFSFTILHNDFWSAETNQTFFIRYVNVRKIWLFNDHYTPTQPSWRGVYWIHLVRPSVCLSVRLSVHLSVYRRHGFQSISQVCHGISISNFVSMLMVAIGRSLTSLSKWQPGGHIGFFGFQTLTLV